MTINAFGTVGKSGKSKRNRAKASKQRFHIVHFTNPSGEQVFRVAGYKPDGARVRENWKTEEEATGRKAELDIEAANIKTATATRLKATRLTDEQIREAEAIYTKLNGKPLLPIFDCGLANYRDAVNKITVQAAYDLFIADKGKQNKRPDTLRNLRGRVGMFKTLHADKLVSDITSQICSDFIFRKGTSPRNQINDGLAVSNFFNWAVRREYTAANPMDKIDRPEVDETEPQILTLADCRSLLISACDHKDGLLLPYVALGLFAGLRPAELSRLTWEKIDLDEGSITIDGSMAKTRQRRIVKLSENAIAWLEPYALKRPPFTFTNFQRDFGRVKNGAGFNGKEGVKAKDGKPALRAWVPDYMRHTAISNHFAYNKHEGETASWAGNSPNVIHRHYKALVKEADAKEFWQITPKTVKSQITKLPDQAAAAA
ncbi:MAG: tyrosine-type recombinase/integrase [Limisphaerales bacterium]